MENKRRYKLLYAKWIGYMDILESTGNITILFYHLNGAWPVKLLNHYVVQKKCLGYSKRYLNISAIEISD